MKRISGWFAIAGAACLSTATHAQQAASQAPATAAPAPAAAAPAANGNISSSLGVIVFPAKNQTPAQQQDDEGYCYGWAKTNTNIDPMNIKPRPVEAQPTPDPATAGDGARAGGALRGAAGGAIIGAIAGDAGTGAAIGAATGVMAGGAAKRQAKQQAAQQQQQAQAQADYVAQQDIAAQKATYNKAFGACMEGKGYTTK